ncbi:hypothetical protein [Actinoplanes xinjiangensis]|jgi:hypothetical protein|uniref:Uncharacterized protein n=1 Tax=Actinoplanes xinjiangensis TaxID=512350 RepID=A0A316FTL6_9ACTN|nr:hypothetical protein [Actinoplanes xinjiangensis]PWK52068.1 hypothetical protein BC793_10177 [Actinoplanes xinjiangensis]GIF37229.1 hypothetical protein Axi01nite_15400 [Actinoplanes xinjiangensis]
MDVKSALPENHDAPPGFPRQRTVLVAAGWHVVVLAAFLVNAYLIPWDTTACDDESGFCVTYGDLMHILLFVSVPFLVVSFLVSRLVAVALSRRFTSAAAAGSLSALAGLLAATLIAVILVAVGRR